MNGKRGLINSPLRQLGLHLSRSKKDKDQKRREDKSTDRRNVTTEDPYIDRSSIYSYESVQTSGRLLDRLDIDNISLENENKNYRNSVIWIDSHSATEEDTSLDDSAIHQKEKSQSKRTFEKRDPIMQDMNIRELPLNVVLKDNQSVESFKVDIKRYSTNSHVADFDRQSVNLVKDSKIWDSEDFADQDQYDNIFGDDASISSSDTVTKSTSGLNSIYTSKSELALEDTSTYSINNYNSNDMSAEIRIKLASQLRKASKDREASYQLQIAASIPNNHPKAMFLYGMALRYGQGVKQSHIQSIKWICKCIIVDTSTNSTTLIEKLNKLELDVLISFAINTVDTPVEVYDLLDEFSKLPKSRLSKIINQTKKQPTTISLAYHELGIALINGWGTPHKFELNGMNLLSKSASMGNVNSMIKLGDLWSMKSKTHKKDLMKAAAWLRLSELFEVKTIGNSWIYKEKYMCRQKK